MRNVLNLRTPNVDEMDHVPLYLLKEERNQGGLVYWAFAGVLIVLLTVLMFGHQPMKARAEAEYQMSYQTPPHQNDYYCNQIKSKGTPVRDAKGSISALCKEWGVIL